jgi:hypothetical protein
MTTRDLSGITKTEAEEIGRIMGKNGTGSVVLGKVRAQYNLTESAVVTIAQTVEKSLPKSKALVTESGAAPSTQLLDARKHALAEQLRDQVNAAEAKPSAAWSGSDLEALAAAYGS